MVYDIIKAMETLHKKTLFWDVDTEKLSSENDWFFIIERILEYGDIDDFLWMRNFFRKDLIEFQIKKNNLSIGGEIRHQGALHCILEGVKTSFICYDGILLFPLLYFGIQKLGIKNVINYAYKKFGKKVNYFHLLKGVVYFEDADRNPDPLLLDKTVTWDKVKEFFRTHLYEFENALGYVIKPE
ncbi:MAG: hypothetical protein HXY53_06975 [Nitrospirae bacterium]|nr:hypothetical protein [Nitrospirota bacterium]